MRARLIRYGIELALAVMVAGMLLLMHATSYEELIFVYQGW